VANSLEALAAESEEVVDPDCVAAAEGLGTEV